MRSSKIVKDDSRKKELNREIRENRAKIEKLQREIEENAREANRYKKLANMAQWKNEKELMEISYQMKQLEMDVDAIENGTSSLPPEDQEKLMMKWNEILRIKKENPDIFG